MIEIKEVPFDFKFFRKSYGMYGEIYRNIEAMDVNKSIEVTFDESQNSFMQKVSARFNKYFYPDVRILVRTLNKDKTKFLIGKTAR